MIDRGAHFFRCDLQVHSPRDTKWTGPAAGMVSQCVAAFNLRREKYGF